MLAPDAAAALAPYAVPPSRPAPAPAAAPSAGLPAAAPIAAPAAAPTTVPTAALPTMLWFAASAGDLDRRILPAGCIVLLEGLERLVLAGQRHRAGARRRRHRAGAQRQRAE